MVRPRKRYSPKGVSNMRGKFGLCNTIGTFCFRHLVEHSPEAPISKVIQLDAAHDCDQCKAAEKMEAPHAKET